MGKNNAQVLETLGLESRTSLGIKYNPSFGTYVLDFYVVLKASIHHRGQEIERAA